MTAEELIRTKEWESAMGSLCIGANDVEQIMVQFAQHHVKKALEAAAENAEIKTKYIQGGYIESNSIDKDSILNSYNLEDIK